MKKLIIFITLFMLFTCIGCSTTTTTTKVDVFDYLENDYLLIEFNGESSIKNSNIVLNSNIKLIKLQENHYRLEVSEEYLNEIGVNTNELTSVNTNNYEGSLDELVGKIDQDFIALSLKRNDLFDIVETDGVLEGKISSSKMKSIFNVNILNDAFIKISYNSQNKKIEKVEMNYETTNLNVSIVLNYQ